MLEFTAREARAALARPTGAASPMTSLQTLATTVSLLAASNFIEVIENRQGLKIGCVEEVAYRVGYIDAQQLRALAALLGQTRYGEYLLRVCNETVVPPRAASDR